MKLGTVQLSVLHVLATHERGWIDHPYGPGWTWGTVSSTRKTLESWINRITAEANE